MSDLRFSIANLLAAVAVIGVGLAALNAPSSAIGGLLILATMGALLVAVLGIVYRQGESRAFWLGAAVFDGSYFVVTFTPLFPNAVLKLREPIKVFRRTFWSTPLPQGVTTLPAGKDSAYDSSANAWLSWPAWDGGFGATANCLVNWLFALIGGIVGRWFYAISATRRGSP
jgi:hypothetical protein